MKWTPKDYDHQSNGILILDEQGFDKVCLGDGVPDANIGQRIGKQTSLVCDDEGFERGWYRCYKRKVKTKPGSNGIGWREWNRCNGYLCNGRWRNRFLQEVKDTACSWVLHRQKATS